MPADATLSQVQSVQLPTNTMFARTPAYALPAGNVVFGLRTPAVTPASGDGALEVDLQRASRLDNVSAAVYGSSDLWWAIADCSGLLDPLLVPPGTKLRVAQQGRLPAAT